MRILTVFFLVNYLANCHATSSVRVEMKIQAMMLSPNGILNPKASMPPPLPPPLPAITHTAATPTINSAQSRRASAVSMELGSVEQRPLVSVGHQLSPIKMNH